MTFARNRNRVATVLAAAALALPAGCGGNDAGGTNTVTTAGFPPGGPQLIDVDHTNFDVFVLASHENNPLFADVYAIQLDDLSIDRLTVGKRVSSLSADAEKILVAAADEDVDRLAQIDEDGELQPIPGLGRPFAYSPILRDGVIYYDDAQGEGKQGKYRYYAYDLGQQTNKLTFQSIEDLGAAQPLGGGEFLVSTGDGEKGTSLAVRSRSGKLTEFPVHGNVSDLSPGRKYFAVTLVGTGDRFGDKPEATVLVNRRTGKSTRVPGLVPICWNPDGTKLLVRRTDSSTDSRLVLLDPAKPDAPTELGTVPGRVIYSGTWVRGNARPSS